MLSDIVFDKYLENFDLTLRKLETKAFLNNEITNVMSFSNIVNYISNKKLMDKYLTVLFGIRDEPCFISETNFAFNTNQNRISTEDFRVFIEDLTGWVPKHVLMQVASICVMIIAKKTDPSYGKLLIKEILRNYGTTNFVFDQYGCLHLIIEKSNIFKRLIPFKGGNLVRKSK